MPTRHPAVYKTRRERPESVWRVQWRPGRGGADPPYCGGLNFVDIYNRSGLYPVQLPRRLGAARRAGVWRKSDRASRSQALATASSYGSARSRLCRRAVDSGRTV